jgi:hypothetical protein
MMARSIAKVNAQSIGGYFGDGTSCFFIRGTILSDTAVDGEYPTLNFMRPGNTVEIGAFDGGWAIVTISTRHGNRPGDNVTALIYLHDDDLKVLGVDCARIADIKGLPFSFPVEDLADGLFADHPIHEALPEPIEPEPEPEFVAAYAPELEPEAAFEPEPEPAFVHAPEPLAAAFEPELESVLPPPEPQADQPSPAGGSVSIASLIEMLRSGAGQPGRNPLVGIGASVAAVAVPMLVYMLFEMLKNKPPDDGEET